MSHTASPVTEGSSSDLLNNLFMEITMETLKQVLMRRDQLSSNEADSLIAEAREAVMDGADPEEILAQDFGLEPDYIYDLLEI